MRGLQERGALSPLRRGLVIAAVMAAVIAGDQASKTWALHHAVDRPRHVVWTLRLFVTINKGIAFSQATGSTGLVTVIALCVVVGLVVLAWRTTGIFTAVVLGLVLGGALGNLADRLFRDNAGGVIDFIDLQWFPVFNVADASLTIGVVLTILRNLFRPSREASIRGT